MSRHTGAETPMLVHLRRQGAFAACLASALLLASCSSATPVAPTSPPAQPAAKPTAVSPQTTVAPVAAPTTPPAAAAQPTVAPAAAPASSAKTLTIGMSQEPKAFGIMVSQIAAIEVEQTLNAYFTYRDAE